MNRILFAFKETCGLDTSLVMRTATSVYNYIACLVRNYDEALETEYGFVAMPFQTALHNEITAIVHKKKLLAPTMLVIIGIGGSNLGTRAVQELLLGSLYNQQTASMKVYYVDTVDADYVATLLAMVKDHLDANRSVIINVITKSGTTLETVANFEVFLAVLKKYRKKWQDFLVITTNVGSPLEAFAHEHQIDCLTIPEKLGGRYSVLSAVGLFPLSLLGIDVAQLCAGAADMTKHCLQQNETNNALMSAAVIFLHYSAIKKKNIHDTFLFCLDAEFLGKWYRQLMAESIGKEDNLRGEKVFIDVTPTVSIGTSDLHSVAQLYLAEAKNRCTTFVTIQKSNHFVQIPPENQIMQVKKLPTTFDYLMTAAAHSLQLVYQKQQQPFMEIQLPEKSAYYVGQFLQFKMFEVIYLAQLLNVNAFDQPNVELYKDILKELI